MNNHSNEELGYYVATQDRRCIESIKNDEYPCEEGYKSYKTDDESQ